MRQKKLLGFPPENFAKHAIKMTRVAKGVRSQLRSHQAQLTSREETGTLREVGVV